MTLETAQIILILVTVFGAICAAVLGWAESGEIFNPRKFAASIGRAIIAGLLSSLLFQGVTEITIWLFVLALLTGAGVDVVGHRGAGAFKTLKDEHTPLKSELTEKPQPENPADPGKETETPT